MQIGREYRSERLRYVTTASVCRALARSKGLKTLTDIYDAYRMLRCYRATRKEAHVFAVQGKQGPILNREKKKKKIGIIIKRAADIDLVITYWVD